MSGYILGTWCVVRGERGRWFLAVLVERAKGFEPSTPTLAR